MIPLFTPATARKDVNKVQGDGELAKLANLNRLVENVNTIVAQGIPAAGPTLTYTNVGPLTAMGVSFGVSVSPSDVPNSGGSKTVQSYYVPSININSSAGANPALTSIIFPDVTISGSIEMIDVSALTTVGFPTLEKVIGIFNINQQNGEPISTLSLPLLNYISGNLSLYYLDIPNANFSLLTYIGGGLDIIELYSATSINFPLLTYVGGDLDIASTQTLSTLNFPSLTTVMGYLVIDGFTTSSINFTSLTTTSGDLGIFNATLPATLDLSNLTSIANSEGNGSINMDNVEGITSIDLSSLQTSPSGITLSNSTTLSTVDLSSLTNVHNSGNSGQISIYALPDLTTLNLSSLDYTDKFEIYDTGITSVSLPLLTSSNNNVSISGDYITSISAPLLNDAYLDLIDLPVLTSLTLSSVSPGATIENCPLLTSVSTNAPTVSLSFAGTNGVSSISLPNATTLDFNSSSASSFTITSLSFSSVTTIDIFCASAPFTSVSFPNATTSNRFKISSSTTVTSISFPSIVEYTGQGYAEIDVQFNTNLTSLVLGTIGTLKNVSIDVRASECALSEASVNNLLALLVSLDGTNGTTLFDNNVFLESGTNAAPTGQGLIDKATLQARGCTVDTN
jgi:hypothetical protein